MTASLSGPGAEVAVFVRVGGGPCAERHACLPQALMAHNAEHGGPLFSQEVGWPWADTRSMAPPLSKSGGIAPCA